MSVVERWLNFLFHPVVTVFYLILIAVSYVYIDQPLAWKIHEWRLDQDYRMLVWVTQLGRSVYGIMVVTFIALFFRYLWRVKQAECRLWFLCGTLVMANGICFVLKTLLGRARPELLFSQHVFGFFGYQRDGLYHSFPSGHTTQITAIVLGLVMLYPRQRWWVLLLGIAVLATRIALTKHYLSDVLATLYMVGLEYKILLYLVAQQCPLYWKKLGVK